MSACGGISSERECEAHRVALVRWRRQELIGFRIQPREVGPGLDVLRGQTDLYTARLRIATNEILREAVHDRGLAELPELAALEVRAVDAAAVDRPRRVGREDERAEAAHVVILRLRRRSNAIRFRAIRSGAEHGRRALAELAIAELVRAVEDHA